MLRNRVAKVGATAKRNLLKETLIVDFGRFENRFEKKETLCILSCHYGKDTVHYYYTII